MGTCLPRCKSPVVGVPSVGSYSLTSLACGVPSICGLSCQGFGSQLYPFYPFQYGLLSMISWKVCSADLQVFSELVALLRRFPQCVHGTG